MSSIFVAVLSALVAVAIADPIRNGALKTVRKPVGTCPSKDPGYPTFLPDSDSCSLYYECSNGEAVQNECPPDLEFNPILHVCDFPNHAGCSLSARAVRKPVGTCPSKDPGYPTFLPDSESCSLYYECSNGVPIQNKCPPGLEFNPTLNVCDFPKRAGCSLKVQTVRKPVGTCLFKDPGFPTFLPDSDSCSLYYECSNGEAVQNECPPDLEFNPLLHVCDFPDKAGCSSSGTSTSLPLEPTKQDI